MLSAFADIAVTWSLFVRIGEHGETCINLKLSAGAPSFSWFGMAFQHAERFMIPMAHQQTYNPFTIRWRGTATLSRCQVEPLRGQLV
jgi:hypothetical protein